MANLTGRAGNAAYMASYGMKQQIKNKARSLPASLGRKARRLGVGAAGALPIAMLAAGVGATTGDPSKALTMAVAGSSAGYNAANYYGDGIAKMTGESAKIAKTGFWGSDLKAINQAKFDKEFMENPETMNYLIQGLGSPQAAREAIDKGYVQAFLNSNITDRGKMAKGFALMKNKYGMDQKGLERAIAMTKISRDINPGVFNPNSREFVSFTSGLKRTLASRGYAGSELDAKIKEIMDDLESYET